MKSKTKECMELVRAWLKMNKIQLEEVPIDGCVVFRGREKLCRGKVVVGNRAGLLPYDPGRRQHGRMQRTIGQLRQGTVPEGHRQIRSARFPQD